MWPTGGSGHPHLVRPPASPRLVAQADDDAIAFQATDSPELVAAAAIGLDVRVGVEQPSEHAVRIAFLQLALATLWTARHEWDHLVHRSEPGQFASRRMPVIRAARASEIDMSCHFHSAPRL